MTASIDLTPERRAELRELAESAQPFIRHGGTDPAAVYVPAAELTALLDACDERDRLAAAVERVRALADNWERLDRALLAAGAAGMSMPAVDAVRQLRERLSALDGTDG